MTKPTTAIALTLAFSVAAFAQAKELSPLEKENARHAAELEAATKKLSAAHVERLKALQKKAMADGNLDGAMAIREEIKTVEGARGEVKEEARAEGKKNPLAILEGKWTNLGNNRETHGVAFFHADGRMDYGNWLTNTGITLRGNKISFGNTPFSGVLVDKNHIQVFSGNGNKQEGWFVRVEEEKTAEKPSDKAEEKDVFAK